MGNGGVVTLTPTAVPCKRSAGATSTDPSMRWVASRQQAGGSRHHHTLGTQCPRVVVADGSTVVRDETSKAVQLFNCDSRLTHTIRCCYPARLLRPAPCISRHTSPTHTSCPAWVTHTHTRNSSRGAHEQSPWLDFFGLDVRQSSMQQHWGCWAVLAAARALS